GNAVVVEMEEPTCQQTTDDQYECPRDTWDEPAEAEHHRQRDDPDDEGQPVCIADSADPQEELLYGVRSGDLSAGDLGQLTDDNVQGRAEQEPGYDRARQELRYPAQLEHGKQQEQRSRRQGDAGDEGRYFSLVGDSGGNN